MSKDVEFSFAIQLVKYLFPLSIFILPGCGSE
jgi:hypothetical protein